MKFEKYWCIGNFDTAGLSDLVDDAISVIRYTKSLPYVDELQPA